MAATGGNKKGGKKKTKGQTISLNAFLGDGPSTFVPPPKRNWADEEDDMEPARLAEEYGGPPEPAIDLTKLPSAPRASRGSDIDMSRLPSKPPYTAFLGNLPFDVSEEDIQELFRGLRVENIRFPQDQGRMKGFGYAEFCDIEQLKSALALSNEKIRNRQIRVDIADGASKGGGGGFDTPDDWRRDGGGGGGGGDRYGDRGDRGGPGDRGDRRDGGFDRPAGPADTEDNWRRNDAPPPSNGDRGDRGGGWGDRRDDRGSRDGGFRDDRGGGFRDDRDRGGFGGDRGGDRDRGGFGGDRRWDDRGPPRDSSRGAWGDRDQGPPRNDRGNWGDRDRGPPRDDRGFGGERRWGDGPPRDGPRDGGGRYGDRDRGPPRGGFDDRSDRRDDRGSNDPPRDQADSGRERPKLQLAARSAPKEVSSGGAPSSIFGAARPVDTAAKERQIEARSAPKEAPKEVSSGGASSSIFGAARPVDTAAKERQIEEKLNAERLKGRGRGDSRERSNRDGSGERDRVGSPARDAYRSPPRDGPPPQEDDADNWRDDSSRTDNTRVMKPGYIKDDEPRGRGAGPGKPAGRGRSPQEKKQRDGPIIPPKYEEPKKPEFVQKSKFAALGLEDDDGNDEEEVEQEVEQDTAEAVAT